MTAAVVSLFVLFGVTVVTTPMAAQSSRVRRATPAADYDQKRWPNAVVPYIIDEKLDQIRSDILRAMAKVQDISCISYIARSTEQDYVRIEQNPICKEPVGRQGGEQKILINITECGNFGFFLHASMQVLGFYHEHQRFDRDEYVTVYPENIDPEWLDWSFKKLNATTHFYNSSYDVNSIMHYGSYQYSTNGKPTLLTKNGTELIPWTEKSELTSLDKQGINNYYHCPNRVGRSNNAGIIFLGVLVIALATVKLE